MDKINSRWLRWIADHAKYLFWAIWGAGFGAFCMVFFKAIDVNAEALRVYMAVLTVMMGGALGLVSSRAMDYLADTRKRRRKIYMARTLINLLRVHVENIVEARQEAHQAIRNGSPIDAYKLIVVAEQVRFASRTLPDFEDVLDTDDDLRHASLVFNNFTFLHHYYAWIETINESNETECQAAGKRIAQEFGHDSFPSMLTVLTEAEMHFKQRMEVT